ncbi:hypothetical protein MA785_000795 [Vibrio parahaemolyticus]|nr:hypothetical protein [Vibrio parahaemolyticus]EJR2787904.1 hypothetical protein [Vibrio parahaemolyticus]
MSIFTKITDKIVALDQKLDAIKNPSIRKVATLGQFSALTAAYTPLVVAVSPIAIGYLGYSMAEMVVGNPLNEKKKTKSFTETLLTTGSFWKAWVALFDRHYSEGFYKKIYGIKNPYDDRDKELQDYLSKVENNVVEQHKREKQKEQRIALAQLKTQEQQRIEAANRDFDLWLEKGIEKQIKEEVKRNQAFEEEFVNGLTLRQRELYQKHLESKRLKPSLAKSIYHDENGVDVRKQVHYSRSTPSSVLPENFKPSRPRRNRRSKEEYNLHLRKQKQGLKLSLRPN